jgi:hypothetical protein
MADLSQEWDTATPLQSEWDAAAPKAAAPRKSPLLPSYDNNDVPKWGAENPNLFGLYGAARSLVRPVVETAGAVGGATLGALTPVPGATLAGSGGGYAGSKRVADYILGDQSNNTATGIAGDVALGALLQGAGNVVGKGVGKLIPESWKNGIYLSGMKPSLGMRTAMTPAEQKTFAETGRRMGAVPSDTVGAVQSKMGFQGDEQLRGNLDELASQVKGIIQGFDASGKTVKAADVVTRLDDLLAYGDTVAPVDPEFKLAIETVKKELLAGPADIPAGQAQVMKQHIYKTFKNSYNTPKYDEAVVQGKKQVARGLKEELQNLDPTNTLLRDTNAAEGDLITFLNPYERAVSRIARKDFIPLSLSNATSVGGLKTAAAKMLDGSAIKTRAAILMSQPTGPTREALGNYTPEMAIALKNYLDSRR